jgi:hypothetical protein
MRVQIIRDAEGNVVGSVEVNPVLVQPEVELEEGQQVEEADLPRQEAFDLRRMYQQDQGG